MRVVTIGRNPGNNVVINDDLVGRFHCQITQDDYGVVHLIDNNSVNGTFINGQRRQGEIVLNSTDIVRIGNTTLPWQSYIWPPDGGNQPPETPPQSKPNNFLVWSILSMICCCLPFGIVSTVYAAKVNDLWRQRDYTGATEAANKAQTWFWWAFGVGLFIQLISVILYLIYGIVIFSSLGLGL